MRFSNAEVVALIEETFKNIIHLRMVKAAEYSEDDDALANFRRNAADLDIPMEMVWAVYASKHWDAVRQHLRDINDGVDRVLSEPIEGRIDDLLVYLCLLKAMLRERTCQTETSGDSSARISKISTG